MDDSGLTHECRMYKRFPVNQDQPFQRVSHQQIDAEGAGQRLDNFLIKLLKGLPKSRIYRIIRKGEVRINGKRVKPETRLTAGDQVRVPPIKRLSTPSSAVGTINRLEELILYEDKHLLVINKPSGLAVHGGTGVNVGLIESLRKALGAPLELVHRLDKGSSGCLMVAKRRAYLRLLQAALREGGRIKKGYLALVHGSWQADLKAIEARLATRVMPGGEKRTRVSETGKYSLTRFQILASHRQATLLKASLVTGRTHQIRVHTRFARHPILGDDKYGDADQDRELFSGAGPAGTGLKISRLMLHAHGLEIPALGSHPALSLKAPLDEPMSRIISQLFDIKEVL